MVKVRTIKEMIEVMQAYDKGKEIQYSNGLGKEPYWFDIEMPDWDWSMFDYRIKPEVKKRPMTFEEIFEWWKNHRTEIIRYKDIQLGFDRYGIIDCMDFNGNTICVCGSWMDIDDFFYNCTKEDGTRFEVEE